MGLVLHGLSQSVHPGKLIRDHPAIVLKQYCLYRRGSDFTMAGEVKQRNTALGESMVERALASWLDGCPRKRVTH